MSKRNNSEENSKTKLSAFLQRHSKAPSEPEATASVMSEDFPEGLEAEEAEEEEKPKGLFHWRSVETKEGSEAQGAETEAAEEAENGKSPGLGLLWRLKHRHDDEEKDEIDTEIEEWEIPAERWENETEEVGSANLSLLWNGLFFSLAIIYGECILRLSAFDTFFHRGLVLMALFSLSLGFFYGVIVALCKGRLSRIVGFLLLFVTFGWLMLQTVYERIFSAFFTLYSFSGAADVTEFWQAALNGILGAWLPLILMLIPFALYFLLGRFLRFRERPGIWAYALGLIVVAAFQVGATAMIYQSNDDVMSEKYLYTKTFIPQLSVNDFGALTTLRLDLKNMVFGMEDAETAEAYEAREAAEKKAKEQSLIDYPDQVLDIDFAALAEEETNANLKDMDTYFASVTPSSQNEYTGLFEGKNLIWIVAEGFSSWALDENLTPTLAKMAQESFVFNNYYNPIWGVSTSDGEYTACTGLLPKSGVWSMSTSADNDMAFCMGNQLSAKGYLCNAYHNHSYTYYNRDESHPNMGYQYIAKGNGMKITNQWPESDVEMMENTVGDYSGKEPFHAYYMTVSGHLEYNFGGNAMAAKHKEEVKDLPYTDAGKAYIACQMEFDQSIATLLKSLKNAGTLDDTLIVISGDHYPYGLTNDEIDDLNGSSVEKNFELYHSTLIIWNSVLAQSDPVVVDKPCCAVDILPTVSNLMGVDYDSRLLMGRDILSTSSPLVVFANHSWLTDQGRYNAVSGEFTPAKGVTVDQSYTQNMMEKVNAMFTYSAKILETDYYSHVVPAQTETDQKTP